MTTPGAPQEEPSKKASNGPLTENLKAPVNVTELSALGSPTDKLKRDLLLDLERPGVHSCNGLRIHLGGIHHRPPVTEIGRHGRKGRRLAVASGRARPRS